MAEARLGFGIDAVIDIMPRVDLSLVNEASFFANESAISLQLNGAQTKLAIPWGVIFGGSTKSQTLYENGRQ